MPRPKRCRRINFQPSIVFFKPQGIPLQQLKSISLSHEELEALRLKNIENLDQTECALEMETSQSTLQRILDSAYKKISDALINGKAIRIE
ncbi:MAG: DUF134 domain-containing protein [Patescibacteria group bacterium]